MAEAGDTAPDIVRRGRTKGGSAAVVHNGLVYVGGVVADHPRVDMAAQTSQIAAKLDELLAANGSDKTRILSATVLLTDPAAKPQMNRVWNDWLGEDNLPARHAVVVRGNEEGGLVEVALIAAQHKET